MIGNIQAFNDEILKQKRRELGHLPIPLNIPRSKFDACERIEDLADEGYRIPFVGREKVRGFKYEGDLFIDTSGMGAPNEPALTFDQTLAKMRELVRDYDAKGRVLYWGLIQVGQFQAYLGYWSSKA